MPIPYPGLLNEQERANLEAVEHKPYDRLIFKEFTWRDTIGAQFLQLRPRQMVTGPVFVRVIEAFDSSTTKLQIGGISEPQGVGHAFLGAVGTPLFVGFTDGLFNRVNITTQNIYYSVAGSPTTGSGWFFIHVYDLNKV